MNIFVSVGSGLNPQQEAFVAAIEERLRVMGLTPNTIGRNTYSSEAPLRAVADLMDRCAGAVVVALERYYVGNGVERRGSPKEASLETVGFPTSWNQIEAAMAYGRGLPLLVLVDEKLRCDGLLEKGNDWYVMELEVDPASLGDPAFGGILSDWHQRVVKRTANAGAPSAPKADVASMSVGQLLGSLKPAQAWSVMVALSGALVGAFILGTKLSG